MEASPTTTVISLLFLLIGVAISFSFLAFWIWMLIDCLKYEKNEENQKLVWALVIIFTNWIGALIYFFVRKKDRVRNESSGRYAPESTTNGQEQV